MVPINDPIAVVGEPGEEVDLTSIPGAAEGAGGAPSPTSDAGPAPMSAPQPVAMVAASDGTSLPDGVRASPLARNMAKAEGVDLSLVSGSGPMGRIVKEDIEAFLVSPKPAAATPTLAAPTMQVQATQEDSVVSISKLRQAIGRRMTESKQWYPHFYVTYNYELDNLMDARKRANEMLAEKGIKLSVNDFIIKAAAMTLREFPNLNASLSDEGVIHYGQINIGVAVAVEGGLMTVVAHNADGKSLSHIATEVKEKASRARAGKIHPDDVSGSTFTTSNLGMFGVDEFTAIINPPEAAILALGAAQKVPVVRGSELGIGWRMKATISVDHRVSDGAEAAEFMRAMAKYLQNPVLMLV